MATGCSSTSALMAASSAACGCAIQGAVSGSGGDEWRIRRGLPLVELVSRQPQPTSAARTHNSLGAPLSFTSPKSRAELQGGH